MNDLLGPEQMLPHHRLRLMVASGVLAGVIGGSLNHLVDGGWNVPMMLTMVGLFSAMGLSDYVDAQRPAGEPSFRW